LDFARIDAAARAWNELMFEKVIFESRVGRELYREGICWSEAMSTFV
jgi:phage FluMu protein gp41